MERQIGGLPYVITETGRVYNTNTNREKVITYDSNGYGKVLLYDASTKKMEQYYIHKLVADYYLGEPIGIEDPVIAFIDRDKTHADYRNLKWVSRKEMMRDNHADGIYDSFMKEHRNRVMLTSISDGEQLEFDSISSATKYISKETGRSFASLWSQVSRAYNSSGKILYWRITKI